MFQSLMIALAAALISTAITVFFDQYNQKPRPVTVGVLTFLLGLATGSFYIYFFLPSFSYHWVVWGGIEWLFCINMAIGIVISFASCISTSTIETEINGAVFHTITFIVVALSWLVLLQGFAIAPSWCNTDSYTQLANMVEIQEADSPVPDTDLTRLFTVSPQQAEREARRSIPQRWATWLEIDQAVLQEINNHFYYVVSLKPSSFSSFGNHGSIIPGYILIDAENTGVNPQVFDGFEMRYVPGAYWNRQLERYIYFNHLADDRGVIDEVGTLEIDDNGGVHYTVSILEHRIGYTGNVLDRILDINPETGEITVYDVDINSELSLQEQGVPDWMDRNLSAGQMRQYAQDWAKWHMGNNNPCKAALSGISFLGNTSDMFRVESINDVPTPEGLVFQITFTSYNNDTALSGIIYANPKTLEMVVHREANLVGSATVSALDDMIDEASTSFKTSGYEPVDIQLHWINGVPTWYAILNTRGADEENPEASGGNYGGVAFLQARHSTDETKTIFADNLNEAYQRLQDQIATEGLEDSVDLSTDTETIQITGIVTGIGLVTIDGEFYRIITLAETPADVYLVGSNDPVAALTLPGQTVTLTVRDGNSPTDVYINVIDINNPAVPAVLNDR